MYIIILTGVVNNHYKIMQQKENCENDAFSHCSPPSDLKPCWCSSEWSVSYKRSMEKVDNRISKRDPVQWASANLFDSLEESDESVK